MKTKTGTSYVGPGESKQIIESRLSTSSQARSAEIELLSGDFLRPLTSEPIPLEVRDRIFTPQPAADQGGVATFTGIIENDSNFDLDRVDIQMIISDSRGEPLSANFTVVNTLIAGEGRFFELRWDRTFTSDVTFDIVATTNKMDNSNLLRKQGEAIEF